MILNHIRSIFKVESLRKKIIATLLLVLVYKFMSVIPVPGVNTDGLAAIIE
jgi:preprotein translocase subunit SecY